MSQQLFSGIDLRDGNSSKSLRIIIAQLQEHLLDAGSNLNPTPYLSAELTNDEKTIVLRIISAIRKAQKHTLLLDAVLRFIDSDARGDWDVIGAASEVRSLAEFHVLERPASYTKEYRAAVERYRQRYPVTVSVAAHAAYLKQVAPGAFNRRKPAVQPKRPHKKTSFPTTTIQKATEPTNRNEKMQALRKADGVRKFDDQNLEKFYCSTCRSWKYISDFPARKPTGQKRYAKYCRHCHERKGNVFIEDIGSGEHGVEEEEDEDEEEEDEIVRPPIRKPATNTKRRRDDEQEGSGDGSEKGAPTKKVRY